MRDQPPPTKVTISTASPWLRRAAPCSARVEPLGSCRASPLTETVIPAPGVTGLLGGDAGREIGEDDLVQREVFHDRAVAAGVEPPPLHLQQHALVLVLHEPGDGGLVAA